MTKEEYTYLAHRLRNKRTARTLVEQKLAYATGKRQRILQRMMHIINREVLAIEKQLGMVN